MHRPVWHRALIALWGLWFAVALIEPAGIHQCPVHGSGALEMVGMGAMPGMDMGGMPMARDQAQPAGHGHHGAQCCCLSVSCTAPAFVGAAPATELADHVVLAEVAHEFADVACPSIQRAHALPFANGPPASV